MSGHRFVCVAEERAGEAEGTAPLRAAPVEAGSGTRLNKSTTIVNQ